MTFREFYSNYREYFGNYNKDEFPILFKIIDTKADLSVQVHPQDEYALKYENSYGKDECWYILEARDDAIIQIGHKAIKKNDFLHSIHSDKVEDILKYLKVHSNDFFYIPSGKVHSICKNITLLEVSQSSDITYRIYDYNRLDNGFLRELHIDKSLDVITIPDDKLMVTHYEKYFSFEIITISNENFTANIYGDYLYVIEGVGKINTDFISKGDFLVITSLSEYKVEGKIKLALIRILK